MADPATEYHSRAEFSYWRQLPSAMVMRYKPVSHREIASDAMAGDYDAVWAARREEQQARNKSRAKAWAVRYSDLMRVTG